MGFDYGVASGRDRFGMYSQAPFLATRKAVPTWAACPRLEPVQLDQTCVYHLALRDLPPALGSGQRGSWSPAKVEGVVDSENIRFGGVHVRNGLTPRERMKRRHTKPNK